MTREDRLCTYKEKRHSFDKSLLAFHSCTCLSMILRHLQTDAIAIYIEIEIVDVFIIVSNSKHVL